MIRFTLAKQKATELLERGKVTHPAVPIERLAALVGTTIRYEPFDGELSGMVHRKEDGTGVIGVNALHSANRRRFTVAHELGHFLLHRNEATHIDEGFPLGLRDLKSSLATEPKEIEANQFAAELLMPTAFLIQDLKGRDLDSETDELVRDLAKRYGVSQHAMTIRLSRFAGNYRGSKTTF